MISSAPALSPTSQVALIVLRTLIGWHFLYEGYFKLVLPAWMSDGSHRGLWSSASYLSGVTGPIGHLLQVWFSAGLGPAIDIAVIAALCAIGFSLMLGLFTELGCYGALAMLALFYVTALPLDGFAHAGAEGNYLIVNMNLIEAAAVAVVWSFRTSRIAGVDQLYSAWRAKTSSAPVSHR